MLPVYEIHQSYDWNYAHAPQHPPAVDVPPCPGEWSLCGIPLNSPLGMPAGPLLNSNWILYYAALGFDTLTYKTVRSRYRASYDLPNLLPVEPGELRDEGRTLRASHASAYDSWAISFGMPSRAPEDWRVDVERARHGLAKNQALIVSVVASPEPGWTIDDVAADFARCARWAADAGAHIVEANLSCPNVCTQEADLYLSPVAAEAVATAVRAAVPELPVTLKVGLFPNREVAAAVVDAVKPHVNAISATNSITAKVADGGKDLFGGLRRGIGGAVTTRRCLEETGMLAGLLAGSGVELISVGGVMNRQDVRARLAAGAVNVHLATAPMIDPRIGIRIREEGL